MKLLTEKKIVTVSDITYSNSAFAVTQRGEGVFINARMVEKLGIEEGDDLVVKVLLNYKDKRDEVKYREEFFQFLIINDSCLGIDRALSSANFFIAA